MFTGFLSGIFDAIKHWLRQLWKLTNDWFWWVVYSVFDYLKELFEGLLQYLPDDVVEIGTSLVDMFKVAHYWVGVGDLLLWIAAYWVFAVVFAITKIMVKMIPTVG